MSCMIVRLSLLLALLCCAPALAQQNVRVRVDNAGTKLDLPAQLFRRRAGRLAAVAIFHGCGGPGQNTARMAGLLRDWGYVALVVDSFLARPHRRCGRNWPTQADAEKRAGDIDAALQMARRPEFRRSKRLAFWATPMVEASRCCVRCRTARRRRAIARAAILVYPDCALAEALGPSSPCASRPCSPWARSTLDAGVAMPGGIGRVVQGRDLIETRIYEGAHHSFDALGLPVRYLLGVGNCSKPGGAAARTTAPTRRRGRRRIRREAFLARVFQRDRTDRHCHIAMSLRRQDRAGRRLVRLARCPIRRRIRHRGFPEASMPLSWAARPTRSSAP